MSWLKKKPPTAKEWASAVERGDISALEALLARGADINQMAQRPSGALATALEVAMARKQEKLLHFLLERGAAILQRDWAVAELMGYKGIFEEAEARRAKEKLGIKDSPSHQIQPSRPWPRTPAADEALSAAVGSGDCQRVREIFNSDFWANKKISPGWEHLKIAVQREDVPMMRLLVTWDARAPEDKAQLEGITQEQYAGYVKILKQYGLPVPDMAVEDKKPQAAVTVPAVQELGDPWPWRGVPGRSVGSIPSEWIKVLQAFQQQGADEAVIAGGALRDTFNGVAIKDVDIFLKDRGSKREKKIFLQNVFEKAGLKLVPQLIGYSGNYFRDEIHDDLPDPKVVKQKKSWLRQKKTAESWKIMAGSAKTEYNIIFVDGPLRQTISPQFGLEVIRGFDFGLCQVACDSFSVMATESFGKDIEGRRITLIAGNETSAEHLERIVKKYPDWELCAESKKLLAQTQEERAQAEKKKAQSHRWGGFGY